MSEQKPAAADRKRTTCQQPGDTAMNRLGGKNRRRSPAWKLTIYRIGLFIVMGNFFTLSILCSYNCLFHNV